MSQRERLEFIVKAEVGGMPIAKTIEQCKVRWERLECGNISYNDPQRIRDNVTHPLLHNQAVSSLSSAKSCDLWTSC